MSPKEKATELGNKFYRGDIFTHGKEAHLLELEQARKYALLCVDEIINDNPNIYDSDRLNYKYWEEVKKQIELL